MCRFDLIECGKEISADNVPMKLLLSKTWRHARVERRWFAVWDRGFEKRKIRIPKDFRTDFASIPRPLWWFAPPIGRYAAAAVCHDKLYHDAEWCREDADKCFYDLMLKLGVKQWKAWLMYQAVRKFGWMHYKPTEDKETTHFNGHTV